MADDGPVVVVTEFMASDAVTRLRRSFGVRYEPGLADDRDELCRALRAARALVVRNRTRVDETVLDAAPRLQVVGRLGTGLDNIDTDGCERRGVAIVTAAGANASAVAEYVVLAAMLLLRGLGGVTEHLRSGGWPRERSVGRQAGGKRLALVGFGAVARAVASRAHALGMRVAAYDPYVGDSAQVWEGVARADSMLDLLRTADVLSVHVPFSEATRGLIGVQELDTLPCGAVVVNTSRGAVVDEEALIERLRGGRLGGAALDVFATEPPGADAMARFGGVENLLLTPHVAGVTVESNAAVGHAVAAGVEHVLEGRR